jgi:hypothetical protein
MRVRFAIALVVAAALAAPASMSLQAQGTPAPVLKKSAPPLRGTAELGFIQTAKLEGNTIVTTFQVKNLSATNAIVGLQVAEGGGHDDPTVQIRAEQRDRKAREAEGD